MYISANIYICHDCNKNFMEFSNINICNFFKNNKVSPISNENKIISESSPVQIRKFSLKKYIDVYNNVWI